MVSLVREKLSGIERLCREHGVVRLWLFGSASGSGQRFNEESDIDLVVALARGADQPRGFSDPYWQLQFALEDLFGRRVQLLEESAIRKPSLRDAILNQRELLYDAARAVAAP